MTAKKTTKEAQWLHKDTHLSDKKADSMSPKQARQKQFLEAYKSNGFNISQACRTIGINRRTFYDWKDYDPDFVTDLNIAQDDLKDYLKSKLLELVDQGNLIATIFACKSLAGMTETSNQNLNINDNRLEMSTEQRDKIVKEAMRHEMERPKYQAMIEAANRQN